MKLIHCSDIHLDSSLKTNLSRDKAIERGAEIRSTFLRMIDYAKQENVSVVMICGDLFDTKRITQKTADLVLNKISEAEEIDFLYLRGNHDEGRQVFDGRVLPPNLKTFSDTWNSYTYENVVISGVETNEYNCYSIYDDLHTDTNNINIIMLHGLADTKSGKGYINLPELQNKNIDYAALGHLHSYQSKRLDSRGIYCYSGCPEGRGFDECGEKGFVLLETNGNSIEKSFIPFSQRQILEIPVDITGLTTISGIMEAIRKALGNTDKKHMIKLVLTGTYNIDTPKYIDHFINELENEFFYITIQDNSRLDINSDDYKNDISLKGEFIRMVMKTDNSDEDKEKMIWLGIQALSGGEIIL